MTEGSSMVFVNRGKMATNNT